MTNIDAGFLSLAQPDRGLAIRVDADPGKSPSTRTLTVAVMPAATLPAITSFTANPIAVTPGGPASLLAAFANGTGVLTPGGQPMVSGQALVVTPTATTTYTLTVSGPGLPDATRSATVRVVATLPPPSILGFQASATYITAGGVTTLTAHFPNGTGVITPGDLPVLDGVGVTVAPRVYTLYTLTVTNATGPAVQQTLNVTVAAPGTPGLALFAGTPTGRGNLDGRGGSARFNSPNGMALDPAGNLLMTDDQSIRSISPTGQVTTVAGTPGRAGSADGPARQAGFHSPSGVAVDAHGTIYVADTFNSTIRMIQGGVVSTLAGQAGTPGDADGTGAAARFTAPNAIAVDGAGMLYVADASRGTIRRIAPGGVVTTLAGRAGIFGSADGPGASARFHRPQGLAVDASGNLYVADTGHQVICVRPRGGAGFRVLAGQVGVSGRADGLGTAASFNVPNALAVDLAGNLLVGEYGNCTVREWQRKLNLMVVSPATRVESLPKNFSSRPLDTSG